MKRLRRTLYTGVAAALAVLVGVGLVAPAAPAFAADTAAIQLTKDVVGDQTTFTPGDRFQYEIAVGCSSTVDPICLNATVADSLPAPLVLDPSSSSPVSVSVAPSGTAQVALVGNTGFTVTPQQTAGGSTGLVAGGSMTITVSVMVPTTTPGTLNGAVLTNTATADADNAPQVTAAANVTLSVATTLAPKLSKSVPAATVPAVPGRTVDWTLRPGNASNQNVDRIVVQDPATVPADFTYLDLTGVDVTAPAGTTSQTVEYFVNGGWTTTQPPPGTPSGGVRVSFDGTFAPDVAGAVVVHTVTNQNVDDIPDGDVVTVTNVASAHVSKAGTDSGDVTDDARVSIAAQNPDVSITKSFADSTLVSGQTTTATITATNGSQDVHQLTVREPSAGMPGFTAQGLTFDGFGGGLAWPVAATSATVTYTYTDCTTTTAATTTVDSLPSPQAGCTVDGFTVTFEASGDGIQSASYATLPLDVTALPVTTLAPVSSTNHTDTEVVNSLGQSGVASAAAPFTVDPLRVDTEVSKDITPGQVFGVPGADANVGLSGKVTDDSTVGSTSLIISDPADPTQPSDFWAAFTATDVSNIDIPACSALTVRYWSISQSAWVVLDGVANVQGAVQNYSHTIPAAIRGDVGGIRFVFTPTCGDTLQPGFNVITNIGVEVTAGHDAQATYTNDVQSAVHNDDAVVPDATAQAQDQVTVVPVTGDGPDFIDKTWTDDTVPALSGAQRTTRLGWSTQGLNLSSMTITDPATQGELDNVASSVFDAFDLISIPAITATTDPLIVNDVISKVELYEAGAWVDITAQACAAGCDGRFGGYTLTSAQSAAATGVRLTISEKASGQGIGSSYDRRPLDLTWRVRDTLRSDGAQYALGRFHTYGYNTGEAGVVNNTVSALGENPAIPFASTSTDADTITILDSPVNVALTKQFDQSQLGLPQAGVAPEDYPLISATLTSTNQSASKVSSMRIDDPSSDQPDPTAFDVLDLHSIDAITFPQGATAAGTIVTLTRGAATQDYTVAQAQALTPADLADVTGVSVTFQAAGGAPVIASGAAGVVGLTWQLRADKRSGGPVEQTSPGGSPIVNDAHTMLDSPGRIPCPGTGCSSGEATASDEFDIVAADYTISTAKTIAPASVAENGTRNYTTTLTAQPNGSARTILMSTEDNTSTFWNTMDFAGATIVVPSPVNQVAMDVLVDDDAARDIAWAVSGSDLLTTCNGSPVTDASPCWVTGDWVASTPGSTVTFTLPAGVTAGQVVGVRFHARQIVNGQPVQWERPFNPRLQYALATTRRDTLRSDPATPVGTDRPGLAPNPGETVLGVITDTVTSHGEAQFGAGQVFSDDESATATTKVTHLVNAIRVTKTRGSTPTVDPSSAVDYVMTVQNTGQWDMTGFHVEDRIGLVGGQSPLVEPTPAAYTFTITGPGAPTSSGFTGSLDESTGVLSIDNADPDFVFRAGWTLTIHAPLRFRTGLSPDTVVQNTVTATSDRDFETCDSTTTDLTPKPTENGVADCSANTSVSPRSSATVALKKWVKGDQAGDPADPSRDDLGVLNVNGPADACTAAQQGSAAAGYYSFPCAPVTRPGGRETWRLDFQNTGNANARVLSAIDTLPAVGDQGVIVPGDRGSQFPVALLGNVRSNLAALADGSAATLSAYYSTRVLSPTCNTNAVNVYVANAAPSPSCDFAWVPFTDATSPSDLATAKTLQFVATYTPAAPDATPGLHPGDTLSVYFDTQTPSTLPAESADPEGTPVAYNSFAGASRSVATQTQPERAMQVLEPQRVGVATATGQLELRKVVDAPAYTGPVTLPSDYSFLVTCTSGGQPVALLHGDGSDASRPTLPGDGSVFVYDNQTGAINLPVFSQCSVVEDPIPAGAQARVSPATPLTAQRDLSQDPAVEDPYIGHPADAHFDIVNTFTTGGFTVTKTVDNGGAVDQDGQPIAYDHAFPFSATCEYLGEEALAPADRTFVLADGVSKTFTGVPTGAECTVTETDPGLAASTSVTLTESGSSPVVSDGTSTSFTVGAADAPTTAEFVNRMTVGSLSLSKTVTGAAAADFGSGPFTLHVTCTLADAGPDIVYDGDVTVGGSAPLTAQIDDLPTDATCDVTEPGSGGASDIEITGSPATIGDDTTAGVGITNTFLAGELAVHKVVTGDGADLYGTGPFAVTLSCVDASGDALAIPGGATRELNEANGYEATYDPLLVGLRCSLEETNSAGATSAALTDSDGNPVTVVDIAQGTTDLTLTNTFDLGSMVVRKIVSGGAAESHRGDEFTIAAACTLAGTRIDVPGGAERTISASRPARFEDLPIGAVCTVDETRDGGADAVTMSPTDPTDAHSALVTISADAAAVITVDNRFDPALAATGTDGARWAALGAIAIMLMGGGVLLLLRRRRRS